MTETASGKELLVIFATSKFFYEKWNNRPLKINLL